LPFYTRQETTPELSFKAKLIPITEAKGGESWLK
jgi:hypothetical protein